MGRTLTTKELFGANKRTATTEELFGQPVPTNDALSRSAMIVHNVDPDKQAENNQKMVDLGIPKPFATPATHDADPDEIKRLTHEFRGLTGITAKHMTDPEFAKLSKDDTENLSLFESDILPLLRGIAATPEVIASTVTGLSAFILSGFAGIFAPLVGADQGKAVTKTQEMLSYQPQQKEAQEAVEYLGKIMHVFEMSGRGLGGIVEGLSTLDLEKANDVIQGKSEGSNIGVPAAKTIGEFSAMFGLGEAVKVTNKHVTKIVDNAKKSKLRKRDAKAYQEFTDNVTQDHPPIETPVKKVDEVLSNANKTPDEVLSDPVSYYEQKLSGKQKADIPVSDVAKLADDLKPEDIKEMSMGEIPSVKEMEVKLEAAKAKEAKTTGKQPEGEIKESRLAERAEADAIEKKLTGGLGDLATYETMSMKDQAKLAQDLMNKDYAKAKRIAMGKEESPKGLRTASVYEAVKIRALQKGDVATIEKLATESTIPTRLSELGQEIKAADSRLEMDPVRDAQDVIKIRKERVKKTGRPPVDGKVKDKAGKKLSGARRKLEKHQEKASKKKLIDFIKAHRGEIGTRQTRRNVRGAKKLSLNKEFAALSTELNAILNPNKLSAGIDPTAVPVLIKMAKNRIEAGVITVEGLVDSIYFEIKNVAGDITKRDIRDAISGYGKTTKPNPEQIAATLRELKAQARLISAFEDAKKGQPPLKSGFQRDKMSNEVRDLQKQVKEEMRKSGIETTSPEQQLKTALDTVKTRLKNQIRDLTKQLETGEKTPKKTGVKYDAEANALKAERDTLKKAIEDIEGKPQMTDEQRIRVATSAVKRSIAEYTRRIKEKELTTQKKTSKTPETAELKSLRTARDKLKKQYKQMQDDAKPPKDPEAIKLKTFKTRVANEIAKIEKKLADGDLAKPEKKATVLDAEGQKLQDAYDRAREDYRNAAKASDSVSRAELTELVRLSREAEVAKQSLPSESYNIAYGAARVKYENYVERLRLGDDSIPTQLKDRAGEFKTTAKKNVAKATYELGKDTLRTVTDNSVAMVATLDNSFLGRQGLSTLMTHPTAWWPGAKGSFVNFAKTIGGKAALDAVRADIYARPNYRNGKYQAAKVIAKSEEQFPANLPGRIPGVGRVFKASETAFVGSGLRMRVDLFDLFERTARKNGVDTSSAAWLGDVGKVKNSLTARGKWGKKGDPAVVRLILWAPKMLKANLDVLSAHNLGAGLETSWARKEAAKNVLKVVGGTAMVLKIADAMWPGSVEWDRTSTDFGKIKIGNTRFDVTGGKAGLVTLAERLITNTTKSTTTGLKTQLGEPGGRTRLDVFLDFLINKVTPPASVVTQWMEGETREGNEFTLGEGAYSAFTPISVRNFVELKDDASAEAVAGAIADLIGINAHTYGDTGNKTRDIISRIRNNKPLTSEQLAIYQSLSDRRKTQIDKQASMTAKQAAFSNISMNNKIYAWSKASDSEREELKDIFNKQITNYIKNNIVYEEDLIEFNSRLDRAELRQ